MITEIGALVSIIKGLMDIGKSTGSFFGRKDERQTQNLDKLQQRFSGLAEQLERCVQLDRLIPVWEQRLTVFDKYLHATRIRNEDASEVENELRDLIRGAARDYFSGAFFYTQYDIVPEVHNAITQLRAIISKIDNEITHIPAGGWPAHWPQLAARLRDLKQASDEVQRMLERTLAALLKELREASMVAGA